MNSNMCNHCGGEYEYRGGRWVCPSCGSYKPEMLSGEETTLLYTAYQKLRLADFAEAEAEFDDFVARYPENADGYWGRLMARYGIKYERDFDGSMIPTCYAASIGSILSASDYRKALQYADAEERAYFTRQAEYIERVRKEWLEKAKKEEPYDIFISYKDSDPVRGISRTKDSYAAQELYTLLTGMGFRVFYSRVSLRDKVGEKYEPYIFHAISTAKVMIVYGSDPEYMTSTWMRNEWMRYVRQIREGKKKPDSLLVACDGFSPEELPGALASASCLRAQEKTFYGDLKKTVNALFGRKSKIVVSAWKMRLRKTLAVLSGLLTLLGLGLMKNAFELAAHLNGSWKIACLTIGVLLAAVPILFFVLNLRFVAKHTARSARKKRFPVLILILLALGILIGVFAIAEREDASSLPATLEYAVNEDGTRCVSGVSEYTDVLDVKLVEIPAYYDVTEIGDGAFYHFSYLEKVEIPNSVTRIGMNAFARCSSLREIRYGGTVAQWQQIEFMPGWNADTGEYTVYCTDGVLPKP